MHEQYAAEQQFARIAQPMQNPMQGQAAPMVQQQAKNVSIQIEGLAGDVQMLYERLAPVLGLDSPHAVDRKETVDRAPYSQLASDLEAYTTQLMTIRGVLSNITTRLEV